MLKISAVYLIGNPEIPIHYTSLSQVEQALLSFKVIFQCLDNYKQKSTYLIDETLKGVFEGYLL